jgi:hypothetical protein
MYVHAICDTTEALGLPVSTTIVYNVASMVTYFDWCAPCYRVSHVEWAEDLQTNVETNLPCLTYLQGTTHVLRDNVFAIGWCRFFFTRLRKREIRSSQQGGYHRFGRKKKRKKEKKKPHTETKSSGSPKGQKRKSRCLAAAEVQVATTIAALPLTAA